MEENVTIKWQRPRHHIGITLFLPRIIEEIRELVIVRFNTSGDPNNSEMKTIVKRSCLSFILHS